MERLNKLNEELAEKKAILNSKIEEVRAGAEDDATDVADVQAGMEEVKQLKTDIEDLSAQINTLNEALDLEPESDTEAPAEDAKPEDKRDGEDDDIIIPDDTADEEILVVCCVAEAVQVDRWCERSGGCLERLYLSGHVE